MSVGAGIRSSTLRRLSRDPDDRPEKTARRPTASEQLESYREQQLHELLERLREGFARLDAGEIDVFELDELIHHYGRSARELRKFCDARGPDLERTAGLLAHLRTQGEQPDWWEAGFRS